MLSSRIDFTSATDSNLTPKIEAFLTRQLIFTLKFTVQPTFTKHKSFYIKLVLTLNQLIQNQLLKQHNKTNIKWPYLMID